MADTAAPPAPSITGNVAFYKKPEALEPGRHGRLGLKRIDKPLLFARDTSLVPITIGEFSSVGLDYPIIFTDDEKRNPLAVMGMTVNRNEFIGDDGMFEKFRYVPAFIRRYPFVFAEDGPNKRLIACVDVEAPMVGENTESPLFNGQEPTQLTREALNFLTSFEQQRRDTVAFVNRLKDLDLFDTAQVSVTTTNPDGSTQQTVLGSYVGISNKKLEALPDATLAELHRTGHLGAIFVHLHSLRNWSWLIQRAQDRVAPAAGGVN